MNQEKEDVISKELNENFLSCTKCLYTTQNYPEIKLDEIGVCDICNANTSIIRRIVSKRSDSKIIAFITKMKAKKTGKYDCIIGISGGADSTYLVHLAKVWGIEPLLVHIDGGWNSESSVQNIKNLIAVTGFDYYSEVLPWEELRDIQKAFIKANVLDIDLPFDNAMMSYLYRIAKKQGIQYIFNGYSSETEGVMPASFTHYKLDKRNIKAIHKQFGTLKLKELLFFGTFDYFYFEKIKKIRFYQPLDWVSYTKTNVLFLLKEQYNWKDYGNKHYENLFTRFYQSYILPRKFGVDKRISYLSTLICSGQITKAEAKILESKTLDEFIVEEEKTYFIKKLGLTKDEFDDYVQSEPVSHRSFKSDLDFYDRLKPLYHFFKKKLGWKLFSN